MIYLFTGNNTFGLEEDVKKWKNHFIEKYGEFNLTIIKSLEGVDKNFLAESLFAQSFFSDKKMVIFEGVPFSAEDKGVGEEIENFFIENISKIPQETIVICISSSPDKRKTLYKKILEYAEVKEYELKESADVTQYFFSRYRDSFSFDALTLLTKYKGYHIGKISSEIQKLLLFTQKIEKKDIERYIIPEGEESIFMIIDLLLQERYLEFLTFFSEASQQISIYALYNLLLSNLRNTVYILLLKEKKISKNTIISDLNLGKKAFLIDKSYKISLSKLARIYQQLGGIEKDMKTGKMMGSEDKDLLYEIQKVVLQCI